MHSSKGKTLSFFQKFHLLFFFFFFSTAFPILISILCKFSYGRGLIDLDTMVLIRLKSLHLHPHSVGSFSLDFLYLVMLIFEIYYYYYYFRNCDSWSKLFILFGDERNAARTFQLYISSSKRYNCCKWMDASCGSV